MFWKICYRMHKILANMYSPLLKVNIALNHKRIYSLANKRWLYHTNKAMYIKLNNS